jgi:hypothetical protein
VKPIEIVFLLPDGKKHPRQFKTEEEAAEYLKVTHATEAPISIRYADGAVVPSSILKRIYGRAFESIQRAPEPAEEASGADLQSCEVSNLGLDSL